MEGLLDLGTHDQSDVTSAERRGAFGDLRLSCFLQSGEEESQSPLSLSLSLSLYIYIYIYIYKYISQNWSSSLRVSSVFF